MDLLLEQLAKQLDLIGRSVLSESTLTRLIGGDPAGSNLARYVHRQFKVADQADWRKETFYFKKFNWKMFSLDPHNLMLIKGANGWVFLKPVGENFTHGQKTKYDDPDEEEASMQTQTTTFEYYWSYGDKELNDREINLARKDLESARHLRYGTSPNKNKYTSFPYVEKTDGIVKSRARMPKEILADITKKLNTIEEVWVSVLRADNSSQKQARNAYRKDVLPGHMDKHYPELHPKSFEYREKKREVEPSMYQGKLGKQIPPGASIEVAKGRQRAVDPEYRAGKETEGATGYENLIQATMPLGAIIARRAMIEFKRKNRGVTFDPDDFNSLANRLRRMNSTEPDDWWRLLMGWKMPYGLAGKLIKSKNKQTQEYIRQLINGNNTMAKQWFIDVAVEHLLSNQL